MTYAITQTCCNDASCVTVCPVNCIHPTPRERAFGSTEMLHIDPQVCIDCGACADACPVDAILPADSLLGPRREYVELNAAYFRSPGPDASAEPAEPPAPAEPVEPPAEPAGPGPLFHSWDAPAFGRSLPADFARLRVAVVGTGPAGMYAAEDLLLHTDAEVTLVDRLPVAGGLVRYGVAPDHPSTKKIGDTFARFHTHPRARTYLGLDVGRDVTAEELAEHHDAVVYAVGASTDRALGIPGEERAGCVSATTFVAWYNAHPDVSPDAIDLSGERAVVVGNGNVALDVARILVSDPETLAGTDIAAHALAALRASRVREVVLLGRRGPEHAAYTGPELRALRHLPGVELAVDDHDPRIGEAIDAADGPAAGGDPGAVRGRTGKAALLRGLPRLAPDWSRPPADGRRIVFRFRSEPVAAEGAEAVRSVRVTGGSGEAELPAGLLLRAIGHRGAPVAGLPFDEATGTVPHEGGRVTGRPGTYVVGWIKRGPEGGIGANRGCAAETVGALLADAVAGALPAPSRGARAFRRLARRRSRRSAGARGTGGTQRAARAGPAAVREPETTARGGR